MSKVGALWIQVIPKNMTFLQIEKIFCKAPLNQLFPEILILLPSMSSRMFHFIQISKSTFHKEQFSRVLMFNTCLQYDKSGNLYGPFFRKTFFVFSCNPLKNMLLTWMKLYLWVFEYELNMHSPYLCINAFPTFSLCLLWFNEAYIKWRRVWCGDKWQ